MTQDKEAWMIDFLAAVHPEEPIFQIRTADEEPCTADTDLWAILITDRGQLYNINVIIPEGCSVLNVDIHPDFIGCKRFFFGLGPAIYVCTEPPSTKETMQ